MTPATNENTPITVESANLRLQEVFAPWILQLNLRVEKITPDEVIMRMPYSDQLCRSGAIICGQSLMALIDTCMVYVCYAGLGRYANCATVTQNTSFLRPAKNTDVIATGRLIKAGRTLVFGDVLLTGDVDKKPLCTGTLTYAVLP